MKKIHLMGINGSGMSGIASLSSKMGYIVTGCDLKKDGHDVSHLQDTDLLIVSPAVLYQNRNHPEYVEALKKKIAMTWEEFLGNVLTKGKKIISICGTHGKSTTTAMVGKLLEDNGFDPLVMVGANVSSWGGNSRYGEGEYFVIEADEFNDNFLNYHSDIIILNNIEFDHPDYFKSEEDLFNSFKSFISNITGDKKLIVNWDDAGVRKLIDSLDVSGVNVIRYSKDDNNLSFKLKVHGEYNIQNALGVVKLGEVLNISKGNIVSSIENFEGIGRRMEMISDNIYDDYAHHPTAIKKTLAGLREQFPESKIWAIVEPHGFDRTHALLDLYKGAFNSVDKVIIGPIFKARDTNNFGVSEEDIVKISDHKDINSAKDLDEIKKIVKDEFKDGDILVVMGAGKSSEWAKALSLQIAGHSFKDLTTLKVGGKIKHYIEVSNKEEVVSAVTFASENKLPIFIIGGGSDIAVSDADYEGVVIKYVGNSIKFEDGGNGYMIACAEAGAVWDKLVEECVSKKLQGMECLSGIPGSVGASPIQNIGAYGQELSETFLSLNAYDIANKKFVEFDNEQCHFGYRESIFKQKKYWQKYIITEVRFKLKKDGKPIANYESLKSFIKSENPTLSEIRNAVLAVREQKLVDPKMVPNAGSFFKNPIVSLDELKRLQAEYPDIKSFKFGEGFKLSAGWLIEQAGWKGKSLGSVKVSEKHALVITNPSGKGKFEDVLNLAQSITNDVNKKFKITLEPEVQYINYEL